MQILLTAVLVLLLSACRHSDSSVEISLAPGFSQPVKVEMIGYTGNIMEPFLSRDGNILFFNNLNNSPENTNLHWAMKINDSTFQYKGEIAGVNTNNLEGVASLDSQGNLYFVSDRNYANTLSTLYQCDFLNGTASNVHLVDGVSKLRAGWVNFDAEISADGQSLYFVDALFDQSGTPASADLIIARKAGAGFQRSSNSGELFKNINTSDALEYAACISTDELELYFTRLQLPVTATTSPEILVATRQNKNEAFSSPAKITSITGFAEAPSISPDKKIIYYHKKENNQFVLFMVKKK